MAGSVRALVAPTTLKPYPIGLVTSSATRGQAAADAGWERGIAYGPAGWVPARVFVPGCGSFTLDGGDTNPPEVDADPVVLYVHEWCTTLAVRDFVQRATDHLNNAAQQAIEREFWRGTAIKAAGAPNPFLAGPTAVDITPGTVPTPAQGFAMLEQMLGEGSFGSQGMIHVPRAMIQAAMPTGLRRNGSLLLSNLDTIVVAGSGYTGEKPDAVVGTTGPTEAWLFATDLVEVFLQPDVTVYPDVQPRESVRGVTAVRTSDNTTSYVAEKLALPVFDKRRHYAVKVSTGFPIRGNQPAPA